MVSSSPSCGKTAITNRGAARVASIARNLGPHGEASELASDKDMEAASKKTSAKARTPKAQSKDRDMGSALRSAYQRTVEESVPDEMLDLLKKLS
jgi:CelD/BcsL family acetyltransferase involved in cellulose biosynthesis